MEIFELGLIIALVFWNLLITVKLHLLAMSYYETTSELAEMISRVVDMMRK